MRSLSVETARRLAITRQHLSGAPSPPMLDLIRDMGCLQLDPISAVARSHEIVLWSRLGAYDLADLERLRFAEYALIEYWAHAASMVLTEDYPLYSYYMQRHGQGDSEWERDLRAWVAEHAGLRDHILGRLRDEGPLPSRAFQSQTEPGVGSVGWTSGRDITHMMDYLWNSGQVMVASRESNQRVWGLTEDHLPEWTPRDELDEDAIVTRAAQRSLRALGIATLPQIRRHFTRKRYKNLPAILKRLERDGVIQQVAVQDATGEPIWKGATYIHTDDLPLLDSIEAGDFVPTTTLLSPFDNLICDRERTEHLWDFAFRIEIYVPKAKRRYGYYVLPVLHGDRLIGRIDPTYDAAIQTLTIHALHVEPNAPDDAPGVIRGAIESLAGWLGAETIRYD